MVIPGSDNRKRRNSKSIYLVNSGSWMCAVCRRKFKFQVLLFNSSDRCWGTNVHTKCFELNACVLCFIKMQNRSPFFSTNWYLFHQIPYITSPVFRPSYSMNKTTSDVSGPFKSLVQIWRYSIPILIWCLNIFCKFLSLIALQFYVLHTSLACVLYSFSRTKAF